LTPGPPPALAGAASPITTSSDVFDSVAVPALVVVFVEFVVAWVPVVPDDVLLLEFAFELLLEFVLLFELEFVLELLFKSGVVFEFEFVPELDAVLEFPEGLTVALEAGRTT
jgi:hypothetical protein